MKLWVWVLIGLAAGGVIIGIYMNQEPKELTIPDDADVEALGRMIASENPRDVLIIQQAIAWTAKNEAARRGISVASLVMPGGIPGPQKGRYASTANPSTDATREVAYDVLSGATDDPTDGAIQFDAPRTQDALYAQGRYKQNADDIAASRMADGKEVVYLPGVPHYYMRFWRYA